VSQQIARVIISAIAALCLQACDPPPSLYLVNNSGATVEVLDASAQGTIYGEGQSESWGRHLPWPFLVWNGTRREIMHTFGYDNPDSAWILRLRSRACRWTAEIPNRIGNAYYSKPWAGFSASPVERVLDRVVQAEPDGSVYVVPPATRAVINLAEVSDIQPTGFPVRPTERACQQ
jgi:hypothetical protein